MSIALEFNADEFVLSTRLERLFDFRKDIWVAGMIPIRSGRFRCIIRSSAETMNYIISNRPEISHYLDPVEDIALVIEPVTWRDLYHMWPKEKIWNTYIRPYLFWWK